ncbi:MAG: tetratricopeptide repeat protein, partial [Cyanobacteria bacterium REEB67]|nr:tetratricopeptide repeat protein [Cyanobacteria bacterium REEB67]
MRLPKLMYFGATIGILMTAAAEANQANPAESLIDQHKYADATALLDKAIGKDPKNAELLAQRARVYGYLRQWTKCISESDAALRLDQKCVNAYISRAAGNAG